MTRGGRTAEIRDNGGRAACIADGREASEQLKLDNETMTLDVIASLLVTLHATRRV